MPLPVNPESLLARLEVPIRNARWLVLLLDYDGTLRPIAKRPQDAAPDRRLLKLLCRMENTPRLLPMIVTGRSISSIRSLLPLRRTWFVGTHGADICFGRGRRRHLVKAPEAKIAVRQIVKSLKPGLDSNFSLEDKGVSVSLHFRMATRAASARARKLFWKACRPYARRKILTVFQGKGVAEARPVKAHKGLAVGAALSRIPTPDVFCLALGDDRTDEDLFRSVGQRGASVVVGRRPSRAAYRLRDTRAALNFLSKVVDLFLKEKRKDSPRM